LRTVLGPVNFELLRTHGVEVLTVEDAATRAAQRLLWQRLKQLVEPSSAIVLAALLQHRERFAGRRVGLLLSGGNVDVDALLPD
jgi:threonine dehydratase